VLAPALTSHNTLSENHSTAQNFCFLFCKMKIILLLAHIKVSVTQQALYERGSPLFPLTFWILSILYLIVLPSLLVDWDSTIGALVKWVMHFCVCISPLVLLLFALYFPGASPFSGNVVSLTLCLCWEPP